MPCCRKHRQMGQYRSSTVAMIPSKPVLAVTRLIVWRPAGKCRLQNADFETLWNGTVFRAFQLQILWDDDYAMPPILDR